MDLTQRSFRLFFEPPQSFLSPEPSRIISELCKLAGCTNRCQELVSSIISKIKSQLQSVRNHTELIDLFRQQFRETVDSQCARTQMDGSSMALRTCTELLLFMDWAFLPVDQSLHPPSQMAIDGFTLHLTYEPTSQQLYMYSPLVDSLPLNITPAVLLVLWEELLNGMLLGGQFASGGVGLAKEERLILMHSTLSMFRAPQTSLKNFVPLFIETVEKWRAKCAITISRS